MRNGRLAAPVADFALEFLEEVAGAADECGHHFDAGWPADFGDGGLRVEEEEQEEREEGEGSHVELIERCREGKKSVYPDARESI